MKLFEFSRLCAAMSFVLLAACGGGGGGGGSSGAGNSGGNSNGNSNNVNGSDGSIVWAPNQFVARAGFGAQATAAIGAAFNGQVTSSVLFVKIVDSTGVLSPTVNIQVTGDKSARLTLQTRDALPSGHYTGSFTAYVCPDTACATQYSGSPITVPYDVTIDPPKSLPVSTGLPDWTTYQGNAAHTGYVPATLDATRFEGRWTWTAPISSNANLLEPSASGNKIFISSYSVKDSSSLVLFARNEVDGTEAWRHAFDYNSDPFITHLNPPATADGRVFVATSGNTTVLGPNASTFIHAFDINTGALLFKTGFGSQSLMYRAPTVKGGRVYNSAGPYGGLAAWDSSSGSTLWNAAGFFYLEEMSTPAVDDKFVYSMGSDGSAGGLFKVSNISDGSLAFTISDEKSSGGHTPVIAGPDSVLTLDGRFLGWGDISLISYSVSKKSESWRVTAPFGCEPVVSGNSIYIVNAGSPPFALEERSAVDGHLQWSWTPSAVGEKLGYKNLIVTDNLVFVGTNMTTYAIDRSTHQAVWSFPSGGHLALSANKVLYIVSPTGRVDAINVF